MGNIEEKSNQESGGDYCLTLSWLFDQFDISSPPHSIFLDMKKKQKEAKNKKQAGGHYPKQMRALVKKLSDLLENKPLTKIEIEGGFTRETLLLFVTGQLNYLAKQINKESFFSEHSQV